MNTTELLSNYQNMVIYIGDTYKGTHRSDTEANANAMNAVRCLFSMAQTEDQRSRIVRAMSYVFKYKL